MERTNDMEYFAIDYKYIDEFDKLSNTDVAGIVRALYGYVWWNEDRTFENADAQALYEKLKADCYKQIAEYKASMVQ